MELYYYWAHWLRNGKQWNLDSVRVTSTNVLPPTANLPNQLERSGKEIEGKDRSWMQPSFEVSYLEEGWEKTWNERQFLMQAWLSTPDCLDGYPWCEASVVPNDTINLHFLSS